MARPFFRFLIYQLGKNIDPLIFREFILALCKKFEEKEEAEEPFLS